MADEDEPIFEVAEVDEDVAVDLESLVDKAIRLNGAVKPVELDLLESIAVADVCEKHLQLKADQERFKELIDAARELYKGMTNTIEMLRGRELRALTKTRNGKTANDEWTLYTKFTDETFKIVGDPADLPDELVEVETVFQYKPNKEAILARFNAIAALQEDRARLEATLHEKTGKEKKAAEAELLSIEEKIHALRPVCQNHTYVEYVGPTAYPVLLQKAARKKRLAEEALARGIAQK